MKFHLYRGELSELLADAAESEQVKVDPIVKGIPYEFFMYWKNLQNVELPEGLQIIEQGAFAYCTSLLQIHLPSTVKVLQDMVFFDCSSLRTVWLSDAIQVLEQSLFENCYELEQVHMPVKLNTIKDSCFASCKSLPYLWLPLGLKRIGDWAFARCETMTSLTIPSTVTHVGRYCFQQCTQLLSLEFSHSLSYVGDHCFVDCSNLRSMIIPEAFEFAGSYPLLDRSLLKISFPDGGLDSYEDETLVNLLNSRFDQLPIHDACYHLCHQAQSMNNDEALDESLKRLDKLLSDLHNEIIQMKQEDSTGRFAGAVMPPYFVDGFGMNPIHLLCLSGIPNARAVQLLMEHAGGGHNVTMNDPFTSGLHGEKVANKESHPSVLMKTLCSRDIFGATPLTYLCCNRAPGTKELCEKIFDIVFSSARMAHIGFEEWRQAITKSTVYALEHWDQEDKEKGGRQFGDRLELIGRVFYTVEYYERKESLSLLECWLWKLQMNLHVDEPHDQARRHECRIQCGADVVIPNVLSFLRPLKEAAYLKDFTKSS